HCPDAKEDAVGTRIGHPVSEDRKTMGDLPGRVPSGSRGPDPGFPAGGSADLLMIPEPMDFLLLLLFLGLTACALGLVWPLLAALAQRAVWAIGDTWSDLSAGVDRTASSLRTEYRSARRRHEYMDWLEDMLNPNDSSPATDFDFLQAKQQWPAVRKLTREELPKWIRRCVCTHRLSGFAAGATYLYEIALEPECFALRERVIGLAEGC